jgi:phage replication O-like protein O
VLPIFSFIVRTFDMDDQARIPAPNYTQIPNAVLDLMADMGEAELRVVLAIARQTFGWHKKRDKISLSQLTKLTGMSRPAVVNGLKAGIERGLIDRTPDPNDGRGGIWYHLLVNEVNQSSTLTSNQLTTLTRTSNPTLPELVNEVNTQKKEKERKERGGVQLPPTLELYAQLTGIRPAQFAKSPTYANGRRSSRTGSPAASSLRTLKACSIGITARAGTRATVQHTLTAPPQTCH